MSTERNIEQPERNPDLSLGALLILLLFIVFVGGDRRRAAGRIRLAAPAFVPLAPDAAGQVADELGSAFGALLDAERRRSGG